MSRLIAEGANHRFGSVANRRQAQGNIERARIFSYADRLVSDDRLAAARFGEKPFQLDAAHAIDQRGKRTADHIACAIAVKFFRAPVPGDDFTVERHAQDCVIGEFDDGGELGSIRLGLFRTEQTFDDQVRDNALERDHQRVSERKSGEEQRW